MASFTLSWFASLCRAQPLRTRVLKEWASTWQDQWIYLLAPFIGALLAVGAFRLLASGGRDVLTGKLFHVTH